MYVILDGSLIFHSENRGRYSGTVIVMRVFKNNKLHITFCSS